MGEVKDPGGSQECEKRGGRNEERKGRKEERQVRNGEAPQGGLPLSGNYFNFYPLYR